MLSLFATGALSPLIATLAIQVLATAALLTVPAFAPVAAGDIGVAATALGGYTTIAYLSSMVASIAVAGAPLRLGGIRASQVSLLLCGAGLALTGTATITTFALGACVLGFGYGMIAPASSHVLARRTPAPLRSLVFSLKQTGVPIGGFLAGATVPTLVGLAGWRGAALLVAATCVVVTLAVQPVRRVLDDDRRPTQSLGSGGMLATLRLVASDPRLLRLTAASIAFAALEVSVSVYFVTFLTAEIGLDLVQAGLGLSTFHGAGIASRICFGAFADRVFGARAMLTTVGFAMMALCLAAALMTNAWPLAAVLALSALIGAAAIGWTGVYIAEIARLAPPGRVGEATGGCLFFTFFGVVCGPGLFGVAATTMGYPASFACLALLGLVGSWFAWSTARDGENG